MNELGALGRHFGSELTLARTGDRARFAYDGQAAVVECTTAGTVRVTFEDRPARDRGLAREWIARYRTAGADYSLADGGCERLARDVADFFSGVREPQFTFTSLV